MRSITGIKRWLNPQRRRNKSCRRSGTVAGSDSKIRSAGNKRSDTKRRTNCEETDKAKTCHKSKKEHH